MAEIKALIVKEAGWVAPEADIKGLHTSCKIENAKNIRNLLDLSYGVDDDSFFALEISLASQNKNVSRTEAMKK